MLEYGWNFQFRLHRNLEHMQDMPLDFEPPHCHRCFLGKKITGLLAEYLFNVRCDNFVETETREEKCKPSKDVLVITEEGAKC